MPRSPTPNAPWSRPCGRHSCRTSRAGPPPLLESAQPAASQDGAARVQALAQAVSGMDEATTLSEVLDALSDGLQTQAPRSAVLVFQDDRARVWRRNGFPQDAPGIGAELHLPDHADLKAILDSAAPAIVDGIR